MATPHVQTESRLLTAEDLWEIDEPGRVDLIRGELIVMPPSGGEHSEFGVNVIWLLWGHVRETGTGRVYGADAGFVLSRHPDIVVSPDAAFVAADRVPPPEERVTFLPLAPDLAIEIVSPSDRSGDVQAKVLEYLRAGTRLVLVIHPRPRTVTAYAPDDTARIYREADEIDLNEVVPGFRLRVADIFQ